LRGKKSHSICISETLFWDLLQSFFFFFCSGFNISIQFLFYFSLRRLLLLITTTEKESQVETSSTSEYPNQTSWWSVKKSNYSNIFFLFLLLEEISFWSCLLDINARAARIRKKCVVWGIRRWKRTKKNHKINDHRDILTLFFFWRNLKI
jgi:hypothetical protein